MKIIFKQKLSFIIFLSIFSLSKTLKEVFIVFVCLEEFLINFKNLEEFSIISKNLEEVVGRHLVATDQETLNIVIVRRDTLF